MAATDHNPIEYSSARGVKTTSWPIKLTMK
jgi:hypothetical protein